MTGLSLAFSPLVPSWIFVAILGVAMILPAYGVWRGAKGTALRAIPILALDRRHC